MILGEMARNKAAGILGKMEAGEAASIVTLADPTPQQGL